jgi:alpha-beta hydrolase superfamily lysophospholipase
MQEIKLKAGLTLKLWKPETESHTCLFLMHGMVEHLGRYQELIAFLLGKGISVAGFHYPGHGENQPLGVMEVEMIDQIMEAVKESHQLLRSLGYNKLVHFAHSMGTYFTRVMINEIDVDQIILSGAAYVDEKKIRAMSPLVSILSRVLKHNKTHQWLVKMVFDDFLKPYEKIENRHEFISSIKIEQIRYIDDPLCGYPISIGFVQMLMELSKMTVKEEKKKNAINIPVTLMSGKEDSIGNMGKAIISMGKYFDEINEQKSRIVLFDGRHEVLNDISQEMMKKEILSIC